MTITSITIVINKSLLTHDLLTHDLLTQQGQQDLSFTIDTLYRRIFPDVKLRCHYASWQGIEHAKIIGYAGSKKAFVIPHVGISEEINKARNIQDILAF